MVVKTGTSASSASSVSAAEAPENSTPAPAQIIGLFAASSVFTASLISPADGTLIDARGEV